MFSSQKHVFWQALVVTLIVFSLGIVVGVIIENWRVSKIDYLYKQSEIILLDIRAQGEIASFMYLDCDNAIQENLAFADRIFKEAEVLARYEGAERLTEELELEHKKYDILRALLWSNSIELKKRCRADFHTVVYIYDYIEPSVDAKSRQGVYARVLSDLKEKKGSEIVLIPIAGDNELYSVNMMMRFYNVSEIELPVILIDEKVKITEITSVEEIEKLL